jgi:hypothetical protein
MNERIRELADQANEYALNKANEEVDEEEFDYSFDDDFRSKFAELIVGKCIDICKEQSRMVSQKYGPASLNMSFMANDCAQAIKEHFKE